MIEYGRYYTLFSVDKAADVSEYNYWLSLLNTGNTRVDPDVEGCHILFIDHLRVTIEDSHIHPYQRLFDVQIGDRRIVALVIPNRYVSEVSYALDWARHHTPKGPSMEKEFLHLDLQQWWRDNKERQEQEQIARQKKWLDEQLAK